MRQCCGFLAGGTVLATLLLAPVSTVAQPDNGGSLQMQEVDNKWVIGPDFRITDVEGDLSTMAGVYGGRLLDNRLLLGAGAYWLVDGARGTDMRYFGPMVQWSTNRDSMVNVSVRSLFGLGSADRTFGFGSGFGDFDGPFYEASHVHGGFGGFGRGFGRGRGFDRGRGFGRYYGEFFVAEPHVGVQLRGTDWLTLNLGSGYRVVSGDNGFGRDLSGASFSLGLQVGR